MTHRSRSAQALGFVGWLALVFGAAGLGAIASVDAASFYARLLRPSWAPPAWAFAPVWTVLYSLMGVAAWMVWRKQGAMSVAVALFLFVAQLCANALWSWLFFAWRLGALAFYDVLVLLALVAATIVAFWKISRPASVLLLPYFAWICLAAALTWSVWKNNPTLLAHVEGMPDVEAIAEAGA